MTSKTKLCRRYERGSLLLFFLGTPCSAVFAVLNRTSRRDRLKGLHADGSVGLRGSGGIGRRASLRSWWPKGRRGSSPFFRTLFNSTGRCCRAERSGESVQLRLPESRT